VDARGVDCAGLRLLVERVGRALVEVVPERLFPAGVDPHNLAHAPPDPSFFDSLDGWFSGEIGHKHKLPGVGPRRDRRRHPNLAHANTMENVQNSPSGFLDV